MKRNLLKILILVLLVGAICGCSKKSNGKELDQTSDKTEQVKKEDELKEEQPEKEEIEEEIKEEIKEEAPVEDEVKEEPVVNEVVETPVEKDYTVEDPNNTKGLSTERFPFSFGAAKNGQPHSITVNNQAKFDSYNVNALAWDNKTGGNRLYLTFDCGYKYGNLTERILDTLKEKNVKAAFFCTLQFLKEDPALVQRMLDEGHIVGNHSATHPDCTTISREQLANELQIVNQHMITNHGVGTRYFRFPTGAYSHNALDLVNSQGYRSIFWSIAHSDWDPANQPGVDVSFATVTGRLHSGAVILLHSTSPDNADILGNFIDYSRNQGYEFRTLDEYPYWN